MEYNGDFKYDLLVGQKGEKIVDNIFKNKKIEVFRIVTGKLNKSFLK